MFLDVDMKNCGRHNVGKHKEIRGSDKYVTLDISSNFDSMEKMKITSSESWLLHSEDVLGRKVHA